MDLMYFHEKLKLMNSLPMFRDWDWEKKDST